MSTPVLVSIGIPAYNEANGIKNILENVVSQRLETNWKLEEILVYCDGCTDATPSIAKSISDPRIKVIDGKQRLGKTQRLQQMFQEFRGEILVMVDADVQLAGRQTLNELLRPFANTDVSFAAANVRPFPPRTFVQRAVFSTFRVFDAVRQKQNHGDNLYTCGQCLALRKNFARSVNFPHIINEDTYLYLFCKQRGLKFQWVREAIVYYKLPLNFQDYLKQIVRSQPIAFITELRQFFPDSIDQEAQRNVLIYATEVFKVFIQQPVEVTSIILMNLLSRPFAGFIIKHYKLSWFTAKSTH